MCVVSYVPFRDKIIISSNRDETVLREKPTLTQEVINGKTLTFPKDIKGGSWICHDGQQHFMVLLNGAFDRHVRKEPYRKSRGLILIELISSDHPLSAWQNYSLENIEPFTIIYHDKENEMYEWVWDGTAKFSQILDKAKVHCWMSSTLYNRREWAERKATFEAMLEQDFSEKTIDLFHKQCRYKNKKYGWTIESIRTVSHSRASLTKNNIELDYKNLR